MNQGRCCQGKKHHNLCIYPRQTLQDLLMQECKANVASFGGHS